MRKWLLLVMLSGILGIVVFAQQEGSPLPPFNDSICKVEAIKKGVPAGDLSGYLRYKKAIYYAQFNKLTNSSGNAGRIQAMAADTSPCANMDFSSQTFASWAGDTGTLTMSIAGTYVSGFSSDGINASVMDPYSRQTILNLKPTHAGLAVSPYTGYDTRLTNSGFRDKVLPIDSDITLLAPGSIVSVRLGNALAGYGTEKLSKTFTVDVNSEAFIYSYAAVLENPNGGHTIAQRPSFTVRLLDKNDSLLPGPCSYYVVYAGKDSSYISLKDTVWNDLALSNGVPNVEDSTEFDYKNWTTVAVDLSPYLGQKITIEFTTRDCALGGHFGYAYIDAMCSNFEIMSHFCPDQLYDTLTAPPGFVKYVWKDSTGTVVGNQQTVIVPNPRLNEVFTVELTSVTGCTSLLKSKIILNPGPYVPDYLLKQNVFTPNGDGKNDTFKTSQFQFVNAFSIELFDRWGLKVFSSNDYTKEWDGKINGSEAPAGVYYWMAKYQSTCDALHKDLSSHGFVELLR